MNYGKSARSTNAQNWFLHRITGTFLIFLLIVHLWVQHYDHQTATIAVQTVTAEQFEAGTLPTYPDEAVSAVRAQTGNATMEVTPYDVVMQRLSDPVYAVLWKGFNILFLLFALHHGFYGLNNVLSDYIRNDMARAITKVLTWTLALVLLIVGLYSVITAGWNYSP